MQLVRSINGNQNKTSERHFDFWPASPREFYINTEEESLARDLRREFGPGATYERRGVVFAWRFLVKKTRIAWVAKRFDARGDRLS